MPSDLISEIRAARALLRSEEERTHEAALMLQNCKQRERKARNELDALLDALESGQDARYPLFVEEPPEPPSGTIRVGVIDSQGTDYLYLPDDKGQPAKSPRGRRKKETAS